MLFKVIKHLLFYLPLCVLLFAGRSSEAVESTLATLDAGGRLVYGTYANEGESNAVNKLIDFSYCGYRGGGVALPDVPVVVTLNPAAGDDTAQIQNALNTVSARDPDANGHRGAVLLRAGRYQLASGLRIETSGVVLRGEGQGSDGTVLEATTASDYNVITVKGGSDSWTVQDGTLRRITTAYVPAGARHFEISSTSGYAVGQKVILQRTANQFWIDDLEMAQWGWTPDDYSHTYERWITDITGNTITIEPPVVDPIQDKYGGGQIFISKRSIPRISECGVENLRIESCYTSDTDENHPWEAIRMQCIENSWVKGVTVQYFAGSAVTLSWYARNITVQDCAFIDPKSLIDGGRRYPFYVDNSGTCNLFQRCYANQSRHDYVTGAFTTGPNAFVDCYGEQSLLDTGPHHRWATGILFDNIYSSYMLAVENRGPEGTGHGWSGAQAVFWNCQSHKQRCDAPKGGMNFAIGSKGIKAEGRVDEPYGWWEHHNLDVTPRSLYYQQLKDRLGETAIENTTMYLQRVGSIWTHLQQWKGEGPLDLDFAAFSGTYLDATLENTDSADGLPSSQWLDGDTTQTGGLWMYRNAFGYDDWIFQSNRWGGLGDSPLLETTLSGLTPGKGYDLFVTFASLGGEPDDYSGLYAGVNRNSLDYFNAQNTPKLAISGKNIHEGYVGSAASDSDGTIVIYVDDYPNPTDGDHRTLYDGVAYRPTTPPAIMGPDDVILTATGHTAQFQITAESFSPITDYTWYRSTDAVADDSDMLVSGAAGNTLTIADVQAEDEDYYYCLVSNVGGSSASRVARLGIQRTVAHWSLDAAAGGQYLDRSGNNRHAAAAGTPVFVSGASQDSGNAVLIDPENGWANAGTWNPSHATGELTVAGWLKWNGPVVPAAPQMILSKRTNWSPPSEMMWQFAVSGLNRLYIRRNGDPGPTLIPTVKIGEWVFVAAVFDGTAATLYMTDSTLDTFVTASGPFSLGAGTDAAFWIGCSADAGVTKEKFNGALDEIQVLNYALDAHAIADLYNDVKPQSFCLDPYALAHDYDHNCRVDLSDFAIIAADWDGTLSDLTLFAESWLSCNRYPTPAVPSRSD